MIRHTIAAASVVVLSLCAFPAAAQPYGSAAIVIETAPPPPRHEAAPKPRRNMVWVPGHWEWRGHRHIWVKGHWIKDRPGYRYHPPVWEQRDGRWFMRPGTWDRDRDSRSRPYGDRDRDGIPNRNDWDRDGDGVPNRRDAQPDNPRRN